MIEENQPKMDYDFQIPWEVSKYIDAGHIIEDELIDAVESDLSSWGVEYDSVECYSGYIYIYGLNCDDYEQCEQAQMYDDSFWSYYIDEWEEQYGDPDDEYEYDDEDEDDDVDESLFDDDEDKAFTYKQVYDELKLETKNFTIEGDTIQYGFDSEVEHAVKILNRHYNSVECTGSKITFADRKKKGKKVTESSLTHSPLSTAGTMPYAVKLLYEMDRFVMEVYDNMGWLMYGVPDGEFEETTSEEAKQNYVDHQWLIEDENGEFNRDEFATFIDIFKRCTSSKNYDRTERDRIAAEAEELLK
jgi:hypothetical protein